ncbi:MAG TPA: hypothetical protein PKC91_15350 [Ignavibacteria bacterium]|nr:hypothetical protein [Ignavibacteria bacterium]
MFDTKKIFSVIIIFISFLILLQSCGKKEEPQTFIPPNQENVDKEKERKEREEFERLKNLQNGTDSLSAENDTLKTGIDSSSAANQKTEKKSLVEKEKELNKRLDNPKNTITDYLELLKRGTGEGGNFEKNMTKASQQWTSSDVNRFKANYKNTKKIIILEEPKVISQKGNEATVEVRIKKIDNINSKEQELEMTVKYNLVADSKGKWKIKDNTVIKK